MILQDVLNYISRYDTINNFFILLQNVKFIKDGKIIIEY